MNRVWFRIAAHNFFFCIIKKNNGIYQACINDKFNGNQDVLGIIYVRERMFDFFVTFVNLLKPNIFIFFLLCKILLVRCLWIWAYIVEPNRFTSVDVHAIANDWVSHSVSYCSSADKKQLVLSELHVCCKYKVKQLICHVFIFWWDRCYGREWWYIKLQLC